MYHRREGTLRQTAEVSPRVGVAAARGVGGRLIRQIRTRAADEEEPEDRRRDALQPAHNRGRQRAAPRERPERISGEERSQSSAVYNIREDMCGAAVCSRKLAAGR